MVVYADVLIVLNLIVDYFLLRASAKISGVTPGVWRMLGGAAVGAISSLYIFLPQSGIMLELLFRIAVCLVMTACTFGFRTLKSYFKNAFILFAVTCAYAGMMIALWYVFKPNGMIINNSVVYFDISPVVLVISAVIGYILFSVFSMIFSRNSKCAERCNITVFADGKSTDMSAIVDTGNSVEDVFGSSEVIVADKSNIERLFGDVSDREKESLKKRYRVLPCGTVTGGGMLEGYRCDSAVITEGKKSVTLKNPILAVSKVRLDDDYSAIVNPRIFTN